jgi:hypothetical protein
VWHHLCFGIGIHNSRAMLRCILEQLKYKFVSKFSASVCKESGGAIVWCGHHRTCFRSIRHRLAELCVQGCSPQNKGVGTQFGLNQIVVNHGVGHLLLPNDIFALLNAKLSDTQFTKCKCLKWRMLQPQQERSEI